MTIRLYVIAVFATLLCGAGLGALWPTGHIPEVKASHITVTLRVNPGASGDLDCTWHGTCLPPPQWQNGNALDWNELPSHDVFWRSHGYRSDTPYSFGIATGTVDKRPPGGCAEVWVNVVDSYGFNKGHIQYLHTNTWVHGWPIPIRGSSGWTYDSHLVAFTVNPDSCPAWTGEHLHEDGTSSFTANRNPIYNSYDDDYPIGLLGYWQYQQSWNWH